MDDKTKYISVKTGAQNSVHGEKLNGFIDFLHELHINKDVINYLLLYHFGDNTLDGSGNVRLTVDEIKLKYNMEIKRFNKYVSYNNILEKILNRFLFDGTTNNKYKADIIYYGNINYGIWGTKSEIIKYLVYNKCHYMKSIHFSSLTYQNWCRNINKYKKLEKHRYCIQIKWFSVVSDLQKIRKENDAINK